MKTGRDRRLVFAGIVCIHLALILPYPILYGGDTVIRLAAFPRIMISYQLPLLQVLLHGAMRLSYGPLPVWLLMAAISGLAGAGLHSLAHLLTGDRTAARLAAVFYACHPFVLYYSHVPYQEPLLLACLSWGFYFLLQGADRDRLVLSSLLLGAACLTRYEGWIAAFVALLFQLRRSRSARNAGLPAALLKALMLYGWAPLLWIIWNRGISPGGTFVLDMDFEWDRVYRPYFIAKTSLWWTDSATVLLGLFGIAASMAEPGTDRGRDIRRFLLLFVLLYFAAMIFSAHGIEPDPARYITERQAFVPISILIIFAGAGAARAARAVSPALSRSSALRTGVPVAALLFLLVLGLYRGIGRVARANADPDLLTDYQVAQFLAREGAGALILARPLPREQIEDYLRRAERAGGRIGLESARRQLEESGTSPFDYQRVRVFSWLGRDRLVPGEVLKGTDPADVSAFLHERGLRLLVVFSDFEPADEREGRLLSRYALQQNLVFHAQHGAKGARIFRVSH